MKTTLKFAALALTVLMASCGDSNTKSTTTTSSENADTKATMAADPAAKPDSGNSASQAPANNGMSDQDFVTKASSMNIAEITAHKSAATHAMSADVKMHAKHMLADHMKMGDEMKALATSKGMTVSNDPPADKKQMIDDMNANKKGKDWDMAYKDWDMAYLDAQVNDHNEAISLFESGSASAKDPDLKKLIDKTLPTLRMHLQMVKDAQSKMNK